MRAALGRGLLVISFALGAALTIAGVIGQLSIPGPLVPATEGVLFLILLGWVHWQYLSRRRDKSGLPSTPRRYSDVRTGRAGVRLVPSVSERPGNGDANRQHDHASRAGLPSALPRCREATRSMEPHR